MKKIIALAICVLMVVAVFAACAQQEPAPAEEPAEQAETVEPEPEAEEPAEEPAPAEEEPAPAEEEPAELPTYDLHIGLIQPGPEDYYANYANSVTAAAEHCGMTVTTLLTEYDPAKEIQNYEDLIAQGVDAIACFTVGSDTAQVGAQLCNEADIPLFLMSSVAAEGEGKVTCTIGNSFYDMGYMDGEWVAKNFPEDVKYVEIQGALGQGIAELHSQGFADALEENGKTAELVFQQTANWTRADAISITEDVISAGKDFNLIFVHNEDMCAGVISVLEENNLLGEISVVTLNGSPDGVQMIKDGKVLATCANPPSYVGGDVVGQIIDWYNGEPMDEKVYDSPVFMIDSTNVNDPDLVTWDVEWAINRVDEYREGTAN